MKKKYEAVSIHLTHRMTLSKMIHFNLVKKCLVRTLMMPCSQYITVENYNIFYKIDTNHTLLNDLIHSELDLDKKSGLNTFFKNRILLV